MKYLLLFFLMATGCNTPVKNHTEMDLPKSDLPRLTPTKYKLALVLGTGGPRGIAHIGILKKLEEWKIHPDLIIGASAGAIIGGLWASGMTAAELEGRAKKLGFMDIVSPTWQHYGYFKNDKLGELINTTLNGKKIEQISPTFIPVATRLPTGEAVPFTDGNLGLALQASSAIAKVIVPVKIDGIYYADADLSAPVPVQIAKKLKAKKILSVDVSAFLDDTPSLDKNIEYDWIMTGIYRQKLIENETKDSDLHLHVHLPYYAGHSPEYMAMVIKKGEEAAEANKEQILKLLRDF